jgi:uncharacterized protein (DUF1800 family)
MTSSTADDLRAPVVESPPPRSRRELFLAGAAALVAAAPGVLRAQGTGANAQAAAAARRQAEKARAKLLSPDNGQALQSAVADWKVPEYRLVRRITLGLDVAEAQRARQMGYQRYLDYQLDHARIADTAVEQFVAQNYPQLTEGPEQLYNADQGILANALIDATVYRGAYSARQLYERMVEFWTDHFSIALFDVQYLKLIDDRDVIRAHALGRFGDLVRASAHSPAMLAYLDNTLNRRGAPNQNYARELMELHTLGVDGGYTQDDVAELSRCLTGWTIAGRGTFAFQPNIHDFGAKRVLGLQIAEMPTSAGQAGKQDVDRVLDLLIDHPNTARYVGTKLLRWFLRYDPTQAQVDRVTAEWTRTRGDIKSVLRVVLDRNYVMSSPAKLKRPFHHVTSMARGTNLVANPAGARTLANYVRTEGHTPFGWETPDGYPDQIEYWAGNLLPRWNMAYNTAFANSANLRLDVEAFRGTPTADAITGEIATRLFAGEMSTALRDRVRAYLATDPSATRVREALSLVLASAEFQYY